MPFSFLYGQASSSVTDNLMTPRKNSGDYLHRGVQGQERISAYAETGIYLLNSYATDDVVANAAAEAEAF